MGFDRELYDRSGPTPPQKLMGGEEGKGELFEKKKSEF